MHNRMARRVGLVGLAVAAALVAGTAPASAAPGDGSAYVLDVGLTLPVVGAVNVGPLAESNTDGPTTATLASVNVPGVLSTGVVTSEAIRDDATGVVHSEATVANVNIGLAGLGTIGAVEAYCDATQAGNTGGATLANVNLAGITVGANPTPNFTVSIAGPLPGTTLGQIVFNEQINNPDGSLTVNAIHIKFNALTVATGDIIISSATCGPAAPPIPLASGAGLWIGLGLIGAAAIPVGIVLLRKRQGGLATA
ncbi:choice-of-anchor P family protein [Actinokineospora soli]|uniref:Choice-of-anchor P family protein n=1 Tax=Actinokineospora soli TaxID=1048753 RepID=A0ABW2TI72_9PSEU